MEDKQLNEKESLELIAQMIRNTQRKLEKVHALPFLIFGYLTVILSVIIWYLLTSTHDYRWNFLWLLIPVLGVPILFLLKLNNKPTVYTFVDKAVNYVWMVCSGTVIIASFVPYLWRHVPILFMVGILIGIATTLTGLITKLRLLVVCGGISVLASFIIPSVKGLDAILFFGAIFVVMQVIPGHILYYKGKK